MTLKVTESHRNLHHSIDHISLHVSGLQSQLTSVLALFSRYYHIYSVRDWLRPWQVLQCPRSIWNYRLQSLPDSCTI